MFTLFFLMYASAVLHYINKNLSVANWEYSGYLFN